MRRCAVFTCSAGRELLPDEPDHPRAGDLYYHIEIGPLQRLAASRSQPAAAADHFHPHDAEPAAGST